jgi:prepilin-type processing-associated H-X9-DG protein
MNTLKFLAPLLIAAATTLRAASHFQTLRVLEPVIDGAIPQGRLVLGSDGVCYGFATSGGQNHAGIIFRVNLDGTGYTILYNFEYGGAGSLLEGSDGALYGISVAGDIRDPSPVKALVFIHEHASTIEDAYFWISQPGDWTWGNFPATLHQNGDNLSFADGHVEHWKWVEPNTIKLSQRTDWFVGANTIRSDRDLMHLWQAIPNVAVVGRNQP